MLLSAIISVAIAILPAIATETVIYQSSVYPNLYFNYSQDTNRCYHRVKRSDGLGWHRWEYEEDDFTSCWGAFVSNVREEYPDFTITLPIQPIDRNIKIEEVAAFTKLFWLGVYWFILHNFYTLIPD